jgi:hypothetical protein
MKALCLQSKLRSPQSFSCCKPKYSEYKVISQKHTFSRNTSAKEFN